MLSWKNFFIHNLLPVTLGNIVGGYPVAVIYSAVYRGGKEKETWLISETIGTRYSKMSSKSEYYLNLRQFPETGIFSRTIYPPMNDIFNALKATPYLGCPCSHSRTGSVSRSGAGARNVFSVRKGIEPPPRHFVNIFAN